MHYTIKVRCLDLVDHALAPFAIIAADVRKRGGGRVRYVLLPDTLRAALSEMACALPEMGYNRYSDLARYADTAGGFPSLIRSHAWDVSGEMTDGAALLSGRRGSWSSAEPLWVNAAMADVILPDFNLWRRLHPKAPRSIWAPNWNVLVAIQALAIARDRPDVPTAHDADNRSTEASHA